MRQILVNDLTPGLILARPVMFAGTVLLDTGTQLTEEYIKSLSKRNIYMVYINDGIDEPEPENSPSEVKFSPLLQRIRKILDNEGNPAELPGLAEKLAQDPGADSVEILIELLKYRDKAGRTDAIRISAISAVSRLPEDTHSLMSNNLLFLLSTGSEDIKKSALSALSKLKSDHLQPVLNMVPELSYSMIPALREYFLSHNQVTLMEEVSSCLDIISDRNKKTLLIKSVETALREDQADRLYLKYLGVNRTTRRTADSEQQRETVKAADTFREKSVSSVKISSPEQLKNDSYEEKYHSDDVIAPVFNSDFDFSKLSEPAAAKEFQNLYLKNVNNTEQMLQTFRKGAKVLEKHVEQIVSQQICQIRQHPDQIFSLISNHTVNNYLISHSLNVSYLSLLTGHLANFSENQLVLLGCAALLHDVGMSKVDNLIWNEPRRLTDLEMFDIKKHTVLGIDSLAMSTRFPKEIGYVAYQHHERLDGSGYPREKKSHLIELFSQIVGFCDVFEAMKSSRPYRGKLPVSEVFFHLTKTDRVKFNQELVSLLYNFVVTKVDPSIKSELELISSASEKASAASDDNKSTPALTKDPRKKIMLIDDQPEITALLKEFLVRWGYQTVILNQSDKAVKLITSEKPDLLIIDLMMPAFSGFDICRVLKNDPLWKDIPIIILTARKDRESVLKAREFNVHGFITKPFKPEMIYLKIKQILENSEEDK